MVIFIDTNVVIDYLTNRADFAKESEKIIQACSDKKFNGSIASHTISNIFYILRKSYTVKERRFFLYELCNILNVVGIDKEQVLIAIQNDKFNDLEDCMQVECAKLAQAEWIITRNIADFTDSSVPAISPTDFLERYGI